MCGGLNRRKAGLRTPTRKAPLQGSEFSKARISKFRWKKIAHPNINFRSLILLPFKHLRRCVRRRTTPSVQIGGRAPEVGETKIRNFYIHVGIQKEIFSFQVTVNNSPKNKPISLFFQLSFEIKTSRFF